MGSVCGRCLKNVGRNSISLYLHGNAKIQEVCVCGRPFSQPDARYCCFCGAPRKATSLYERKDSDTSAVSAGVSIFTEVVPAATDWRTTRRSWTAGSSSTVSSTGSAMSRSHSKTDLSSQEARWRSETSEEPPCEKSHHNSRCSSRSGSAGSRSTRDSTSATAESPRGPNEKRGEARVRNRSRSLSGIVTTTSSEIASPRLRKQSHDPQPASPRGTPARRSSYLISVRRDSNSSSEDMVSALSQALNHTGCFVTKSMRMRALQVPDEPALAYTALVKPDMQMPSFDAKVNADNLLMTLPLCPLKPQWMSLQRVSFMNTDWLGLRLASTSHNDCTLFSLCVAAVQNIGKNTSRSVVVETSGEEVEQFSFACAPTYMHSKKSRCSTSFIESFIDHAEDLGELAAIILNESGTPQRKVTADLKRWCQKHQRQMGEEHCSLDNNKVKVSSLRSFVNSIEESLTVLGADPNSGNHQGKGGGWRHHNRDDIRGSASHRRRHSSSPERHRRASLPSERQSTRHKRSEAVATNASTGTPIERRRRSAPELFRRNSDPASLHANQMFGPVQDHLGSLKRKKSVSSDSSVMPTVNEDEVR